jgi:hypothetical protein
MLTIINLLCNLVLCGVGTMVFLTLFTHQSSIVHKWSILQHWALKFGLSAFIAGSLFNVLTLSTPPWTEVVLNIGLAFIFIWVNYFHYKIFYPSKDLKK